MNNESSTISPQQRLVYISCFVIWTGFGVIQTTLIWWHAYNFELAINDSLISATVLTVTCFIIGNALNYYLPSRRKYFQIAIWAVVMSIASLFLTRSLLFYFISDAAYLKMVDQSLPLRFIFFGLVIAWMATIHILWNIQQEYTENEQRKADAERLAREAELYNLRQQLQPHFLFNSLNSIIALISKKPDEARNMTFQLSDFLRGTLRKDDQQMIELKEELDHIRLYLDIEKVRFGHRLETEIRCDDVCETALLPVMIMQPLVENAIKFGLYDTTGRVKVSIDAFLQESMLELQISNPYDQEKNVPKRGTGFGLRGVQRRLFLLFGRTDLLETRTSDKIFTSILRIPQLRDDESFKSDID